MLIKERKDYFKIFKNNIFPSVNAYLDGVSRQLLEQETRSSVETSNQQLINAFLSVRMSLPLMTYSATWKKKKMQSERSHLIF